MSELPPDVIEAATRLTRLARKVGDPAEAAAYRERRDDQLSEFEFIARVREDDQTLVLYPDEWLEDGTVVLDRIEDTDRAVERSLTASNEGSWREIEAHNREIVAAVDDAYGSPHTETVRAFADFMGNHYLGEIDNATDDQLEEFTQEYFVRNAWPSKKQREVVATSLSYITAVSEADCPGQLSE